jgi:hypothetical protein
MSKNRACGMLPQLVSDFLLRFLKAASAVLPGVGLRVMGVLMIRDSTEACGLPGH